MKKYAQKMKSIAIITIVMIQWMVPLQIFAQQDVRTVDMNHVNKLKEQGKLTGNERYVNYAAGKSEIKITPSVNRVATGSGNCSCWMERDSTWSVAAFDGSGGSGGPGVPPDYRNDDWSTVRMFLSFDFCFYNNVYNSVFINNNGNISLDTSYSTFTATAFPNNLNKMIAPLWSDCDTRDLSSGIVYYKMGVDFLVVQWDSVGYYNTHSDKLNSYQLIISNGVSEVIPNGNNIAFCYRDMQWTTGDASMGTGGFGGTPATAGVNRGDGINYLQLGLFDQPGAAYDGPFGNNDGIDALDNQYFYFRVCDSTVNVAPIIHASQICDSVTIYVGDSIFLNGDFLSPEASQTTTPSYTTTATAGVTLVSSSTGNTAQLRVKFVGMNANLGYNIVELSGTDNGTPPKTSSSDFVIQVIPVPIGMQENSNSQNVSIYPNPADETIHIALKHHEARNIDITLTDAAGREVYKEQFNHDASKNDFVISSAHFPKGFYLLTLKSDNQSIVKRIEVLHGDK